MVDLHPTVSTLAPTAAEYFTATRVELLPQIQRLVRLLPQPLQQPLQPQQPRNLLSLLLPPLLLPTLQEQHLLVLMDNAEVRCALKQEINHSHFCNLGSGWTGPTTCVAGYKCTYSNDCEISALAVAMEPLIHAQFILNASQFRRPRSFGGSRYTICCIRYLELCNKCVFPGLVRTTNHKA